MTNSPIGSLDLCTKHHREWGDDGTTTMFAKKQAMSAGINFPCSIKYVPQHRRSARRIIAGVVLWAGVWLLLLWIALMAWRAGWI